MSWLKKARSYRVLIAFMSGFAAASLMWFFVSHSSRNLPVERGAVLMPGALGDSLLLQHRALPPATASGPRLPAIPGKPPTVEDVREPPMPGPVANLPVPGVVKDPPMPGPAVNLPVRGVVKDLPMPGPVTNLPVPGPSGEPPLPQGVNLPRLQR